MPLLDVDSPLATVPRRVLVTGSSGAGKSTLARRIASELALPYTEIDALHHGPRWVPRAEFLADVSMLAARENWVTEWQYQSARPLLIDRADLMVWLNLPRATVMRQVTARTIVRRVRRETLWNGNQEGPLWQFFTDPEHVIRWAWSTYARMQQLALEAAKSTTLPVVQLLSHSDADRWLDRLAHEARRP